MGAVPPKLAESVVRLLLPPACREEVLGDLHERCEGPSQYVFDAARVVPLVIASRIRRVTDPTVMLIEAFVLYQAFLFSALIGDRRIDQDDLMRLAIPAAVALLILRFHDAYASPQQQGAWRIVRGPSFAIAGATLSQGLIAMADRGLTIPVRTMIFGGALALLVLSMVRKRFPPLADRPVGAAGPAIWMQQTAEPVRLSSATLRVLKTAGFVLLAGLIFLLATLYHTS